MKNSNEESALHHRIFTVSIFLFCTTLAVTSAVEQKAEITHGTDGALYHAASSLRDPLWPVGYRPKLKVMATTNAAVAVIEEDVSTDWNKAMQEIAIQGVSSRAGNEFYAVINGEVKSKGDTVSVQVGRTTFTWMIENILPPSSVKMRRVSVQ